MTFCCGSLYMIFTAFPLNFDPAKEILKKCQIYVSVKKMIILRKIQVTMKIFAPPFFNHFSLSLNRKKGGAMRTMEKETEHIQG